MALEVKKQEKETSQALIYRFQKSVQQSGILFRARKAQFRQRKKSHEMKKRAALRKKQLEEEYKKLKKLGKTAK